MHLSPRRFCTSCTPFVIGIAVLTLASSCAEQSTAPGTDALSRDLSHEQPRPADLRQPGADGGEGGPHGDAALVDLGAAADGAAEAAADLQRPGTDLGSCEDPGVTLEGAVQISPSRLSPGATATIRYRGPLVAAGQGVVLHYSFNHWAWPQPAGAPHAFAAQLPMSAADGTTATVTVAIPSGMHQLDFVFTDPQGSSWDNNSGRDWHRAIDGLWMGPYLSWRDNTASAAAERSPARTMVVHFQSERACVAQLRWGSAPDRLDGRVEDRAATLAHHLVLSGLAAETRYFYRVGCLDQTVRCGLFDTSAVHAFRTAPEGAQRLKLLVLGDPQDNNNPLDRWEAIAQELATPPHGDAHLVVIAGDLAGDDTPERWRDFFRKGLALLATHPLFAAIGNHDTPSFSSNPDASHFRTFFEVGSSSGDNTVHALSLGPLTLFGLNSELAQAGLGDSWRAPNGSQYAWLSTKLVASKTPWNFAVWHIPPVNAGVRHSGQNTSTHSVLPLFTERLDWVIGGHEHLYQRSKPLRYAASQGATFDIASTYGTARGAGVGYLVAPTAGHYTPEDTLLGAGDPLRALLAYPGAAELHNDTIDPWVGYLIVEIDGKAIRIEARALATQTPKDVLAYTKD